MDETRYFDSIRTGDVSAVRDCVAADPGLLRARCSPGYAPDRDATDTGLHLAVFSGQVEVARFLIDAGIEIDARNAEGRTALHDAIEFGQGAITELLERRGAEIDICAAAILGRIERVEDLLDGDPGLANDSSTQLSPLGWAAFGNQVGTASMLLDRGAKMDDGELLCAASVGHVEVGRLLISRGADADRVEPGPGANALHAAVSMKYTADSRAFVKMLLESGADPSVLSGSGKTALELAESKAREQEAAGIGRKRKRFEEVAEMLRELDG